MLRLIEAVAARWPWARANRFARAIKPRSGHSMVRIGTDYGGWVIPDDLLDSSSICYCAGVGTDVSFDLGLIDRYGCQVFAFDPTPAAVGYIASLGLPDEFHFDPVALWNADTQLVFSAPRVDAQNWSAVGAEGSARIEAPSRSLASLMDERGHQRLDLLKLDIEGAEYPVLEHMLDERLEVRALCVEFHKTPSIGPMIQMVDRLRGAGYEPLYLEGFEVTFARPWP